MLREGKGGGSVFVARLQAFLPSAIGIFFT